MQNRMPSRQDVKVAAKIARKVMPAPMGFPVLVLLVLVVLLIKPISGT